MFIMAAASTRYIKDRTFTFLSILIYYISAASSCKWVGIIKQHGFN